MKFKLFISLLLAHQLLSGQNIGEIADNYINENGVRIIEDFRKLLSIPNVAFDLPNINKKCGVH